MKEVVKEFDGQPWTDLLTSGKPYLYYNPNTKRYHILYWKVWGGIGGAGNWSGSNWYDEPPKKRWAPSSQKWGNWPIEGKVYELPGVKYRKPKNITGATRESIEAYRKKHRR